MESTPGQSGDSHPCCLVEQQREEYSEHLLLAYGLLCSLLAGLLCSSEVSLWVEEVHKFLFFFDGSSSEDLKISNIHDI